MTEEIIINGVDVAGCEFRKTHSNSAVIDSCNSRGYVKDDGLHIHINCKDNPNCYYKQLKRLKKEVKHWQMEHREAKAKGEWTYDLVRKKVDRLEQENKELKEAKEQLKKWLDANLERQNDMQKQIDLAEEQRKNYRSALEEIREIAKDIIEN